MSDQYQKFRLGEFNQVKEVIKNLNEQIGPKVKKNFSLVKMEGKNNLWIIQEEDEENINCGIIEVERGTAFAVSREVYDFLFEMFQKVL